MKSFRLSKNHNNTGIFTKENENLENPDGNEQIGMQIIHLNQAQQQNDNHHNINHIHINPMGPGVMGENPHNEIENLNQIDNLDME